MKKILIIEDDESIAQLQKDYLELSGFEVRTCGDGVEGLNEVKENKYDLIILDVMLPKLDGFGILRSMQDYKDIPVLMVSAKKKKLIKSRDLHWVRMTILLSLLALENWWQELNLICKIMKGLKINLEIKEKTIKLLLGV